MADRYKTREPDERFLAQVPDFELETRKKSRYRTWRDDPDENREEDRAESAPSVDKTTCKVPSNDLQTDCEEQQEEAVKSDSESEQPIENPLQTDCKVPANDLQTDCDIDCKVPANDLQTDCEISGENSKLPAEPTADETQSICKVPANDLQTDCNFAFSDLIGVQRELLLFYYENILANGGQNTLPVTLEYLMEATGNCLKTLKNANYRLLKKGLLERVSFKNGRGGWVVYTLPKSVREEVHRMRMVGKLPANNLQTARKPTAEPTAEPTASPPSSSSSKDLKTNSNTTTTQKPDYDYSWISQLDFPTNVRQYINDSHIRQLVRLGFGEKDAGLLQESLDNFEVILETPGHGIKLPASWFMGVMREHGYVAASKVPQIQISKARMLMQDDMAKIEAQIQQEVERLARERLEQQVGKPSKSLDDFPL